MNTAPVHPHASSTSSARTGTRSPQRPTRTEVPTLTMAVAPARIHPTASCRCCSPNDLCTGANIVAVPAVRSPSGDNTGSTDTEGFREP